MSITECDLAIKQLDEDLKEMERGRFRHYHAAGDQRLTDCTEAMIRTSKCRIEQLRRRRLLA